jgi:G:T-mismatch repair DNA endonuclease (very short patch repair protein)
MSAIKGVKQTAEHIAHRVAAIRASGQYDRVGEQVRKLRKGKTLDEIFGIEGAREAKRKNSLKHTGKIVTKESNDKRSKSLNETNDKKRALGIPLRSDEDRKRSSIRMLNNNPMKNPITAKKTSEGRKKYLKEHPKEMMEAVERMKAKSIKVSSIEFSIRKLLDKIGIYYTPQYRVYLSDSKLHFTDIDVYIPSWKLAIYCDGDYWHNLLDYIERDNKINKKLEEMGYNVLRLWEHEIKRDESMCLKKILNYKK